MSNLELDKPIFAATAEQATSWDSVSAGARLDFAGDIQLRRGLDIDLGLSLMANLDASFRQFLAADLQGQGQAQASVRGQIQLPLNLFDEAGLAVRLQAVAELAAGLRIGLGLTFGDFINLAGQDPHMNGLPLKLLVTFLEQVDLEASLFAKAAVSAQAYANVVAVGSLIHNPQTGTGPGFTIAAGAGAGLKAGAGFQISATVGIRDISQLIGKTVDLLVDSAIDGITAALPQSAKDATNVIRASRAPIKIALRIAFELGEQLAVQVPAHSANGQDSTSQCCLQVVLEELQRASFEGFLEAVTAQTSTLLTNAARTAANEWSACSVERHDLAGHLRSAPESLFSAEAIPFWTTAAGLTAAVAAKLASANSELLRQAAIIWSAAQLLDATVKRIQNPDRSKRNRPLRQVAKAFTGALPVQPPPEIAPIIRGTLQQNGAHPGQQLTYDDLVRYLTDASVVQLLKDTNPSAATLLNSLIGPFAPDLGHLLQVILGNASSFAVAPNGQPDPAAALTALTSGVSQFVADKIDDELRRTLQPAFDQQPDLRTVFDEVFIPSLDFALAVTFTQVINWAKSSVPAKTLTEALSAVLLRVLGRSLVVTSDILLFKAQQSMSDALQAAAAAANKPHGLVEELASLPGIGVAAADVAELVTDALTIAGDVFGPLPDEKRQHIRGLLYQAIDPLAGRPASEVLTALNDPGLPNVQVMDELASELGNYAVDRFLLFVERFVGKLLDRMSAAVQAALDQAAATVSAWIDSVQQGLTLAAQRLNQIAGEIAAAAAEVARRLSNAMAALLDVLASFNTASSRSRFVNSVADAAYAVAAGVLEGNYVYHNLVPGSIKADIRSTVKSVLRTALQASPLDTILSLIGGVADDAQDLIDAARQIPRGAGFAASVRELVLDRLVAAVNGSFGPLGVHVRFQVDIPLVGNRTIDLGAIAVPLTALTGSVRQMIEGVNVFDDAINSFASELSALFQAEASRDAAASERQSVQGEQQRLSGLLDVFASNSPSVSIDSPVNLQNVSAGAPVRIRLLGFKPAILSTGPGIPQRVQVIINGKPADLSTFEVTNNDAESLLPATSRLSGTARSLPLRGAVNGANAHNPLLGASIGQPAAIGQNFTNSANASLVLTGVLDDKTIATGLNSIHVEVIVDAARRYSASGGFYVNNAAKAAQKPLAARPGRARPVAGPPPKASGVTKDDLHLFLPTIRTAALQALKETAGKPPVQSPLLPLASISPSIAAAAGIQVAHPLPRPAVRFAVAGN